MFKLFKYDFRAIAKRLIPLYIVGIVIGTLNVGVSLVANHYFKNTFSQGITPVYMIMQIIGMLSSFIFSIIVIYISILTIYILITNFNSSVYGNEGYLINSLPIKSRELILAKYLNFVFWTFVANLFGLIFQAIRVFLELEKFVKNIGEKEINDIFRELSLRKNELLNNPLLPTIIILGIIIIICMILFSLLNSWIFMTSVTVANVIKSNKIVIGILTYFLINFGIGIISLIIFFMSVFEWSKIENYPGNGIEIVDIVLKIYIKYGIIYMIFLILLNIGTSFFINHIHSKKLDLE